MSGGRMSKDYWQNPDLTNRDEDIDKFINVLRAHFAKGEFLEAKAAIQKLCNEARLDELAKIMSEPKINPYTGGTLRSSCWLEGVGVVSRIVEHRIKELEATGLSSEHITAKPKASNNDILNNIKGGN